MFQNIPSLPITHHTTYGHLSHTYHLLAWMDTIKDLGIQLDQTEIHAHRPHFLPNCKDAGLNINFNLFLFYPWQLINIAFKTS
jgi:hypothetical protein